MSQAFERKLLVITCVLLAVIATAALVFSFQSADRAARAEQRTATNRVINCWQVQQLNALLERQGVARKYVPQCDDLDDIQTKK